MAVISDDATTDKNGSPSDTLNRLNTVASRSLKAATNSSSGNNERSYKRTTGKRAEDSKSVLTQMFYKDAFMVRYNDKGRKYTKILSENEFQREFLKYRPENYYW